MDGASRGCPDAFYGAAGRRWLLVLALPSVALALCSPSGFERSSAPCDESGGCGASVESRIRLAENCEKTRLEQIRQPRRFGVVVARCAIKLLVTRRVAIETY